jgi:hypothetical protein
MFIYAYTSLMGFSSSWTHVRWLDPNSSYMRPVAVCILVVMWNVSGQLVSLTLY